MTNNFEVFRKINYRPFENNGKQFLLSDYPYLDIVFNDHCNAKCKFCIGSLVHKKEWATLDFHRDKIKYAIENLGVKEVLLLGGEPTINTELFDYVSYLKTFNLNKICITTNGHKMSKDLKYAEQLFASGITHVNLSLMSLDEEKQLYISGSKTYVSLDHLKEFKKFADANGVSLRINNNCFKGNNDNLEDILDFYYKVKDHCHSVKFSPLLKTDSFSTINRVTEFNREHLLTDEHYDSLWKEVENHFSHYPIVRNKETFGFVEYSQMLLPTPIILNYNQHGQLRNKIVKEGKINNLKLLSTGNLSLSWNREESDYFINTSVEEKVLCDQTH